MASPVLPLIKYLLTLFRSARGTIGAVEIYSGDTPPPEWFECDGRALSSTDYPDLYDVIDTRFGDGSAGIGASGSTDFNLPDLRGRFVRGYDSGSGNDPDNASRTPDGAGSSAVAGEIGTLQSGGVGDHVHYGTPGRVVDINPFDRIGSQATYAYITGSSGGTGTFGAEVRPVNISLMYIIKF